MKTSSIVTIILIIMSAAAFYGGYRQGIFGKGRWMLGIVISILAVPVISPFIENLILNTQLAQMILTDAPVLRPLTAGILRAFVFSLSLILVKKTVYMLTDFELPPGIRIADKLAGAAFSVLEFMVIIWIFELLMKVSLTASLFNGFRNVLMESGLYSFIAGHNILARLF